MKASGILQTMPQSTTVPDMNRAESAATSEGPEAGDRYSLSSYDSDDYSDSSSSFDEEDGSDEDGVIEGKRKDVPDVKIWKGAPVNPGLDEADMLGAEQLTNMLSVMRVTSAGAGMCAGGGEMRRTASSGKLNQMSSSQQGSTMRKFERFQNRRAGNTEVFTEAAGGRPRLVSDSSESSYGEPTVIPEMKRRTSLPTMITIIGSNNVTSSVPSGTVNPCNYVITLMELNGLPNSMAQPRDAKDLPPDFFTPATEEEIDAYNKEVLTAVRQADMRVLRMLRKTGHPIRCCNRFGESTVHLACRRAHLEVVQYMVQDLKISIRMRDDYGRTPLHDACWAKEPAFDVVRLLIETDPDLLLVKDARGFTPMGYVRKDDWGRWCEFLTENQSLLKPRELGSC